MTQKFLCEKFPEQTVVTPKATRPPSKTAQGWEGTWACCQSLAEVKRKAGQHQAFIAYEKA
jgi:hypothetical protein